MASPRRPAAATTTALLLAAVIVAGCGDVTQATPTVGPSAAAQATGSPAASTPPPAAGRELYGYLPYWEMDEGIVDHLATTPVSTLALFSVTHTASGGLRTGLAGYERITGDLGRRVIAQAHGRGSRVELVYTSFGRGRNRKLFASQPLQDAVIASLVGLAGELALDGVNVDVEALDPELVPAYGAFVGRLHDAVVAADPGDRVTVSTGAGLLGAAMASAAGDGADRVFLMGYDYRTGASAPGATSPLARRDGDEKDLPWSLDLYAALGVPSDRLLLGLPLYGVTWPVAGPVIGAPATGRGATWILRKHADLLLDPSVTPLRDDVEAVEVYLAGSDGSTAPPSIAPSAAAPGSGVPPASPAATGSPAGRTPAGASPSPAAGASPGDVTWTAVYVDSPDTLAPKLQLALDRGLAGAGFWAIGYERGLPAYTELMRSFGDGGPLP